MKTKVCSKCGQEKLLSDFYEHKRYKGGHQGQCKECMKLYWHTRRNRTANNEASKKYYHSERGQLTHRKYELSKYNLTLDDYNKLFEKQNGCCAICEISQSKLNKALFVDHSHCSGEVRGLLCQKCNSALGLFDDNIKLVKKALKYLS